MFQSFVCKLCDEFKIQKKRIKWNRFTWILDLSHFRTFICWLSEWVRFNDKNLYLDGCLFVCEIFLKFKLKCNVSAATNTEIDWLITLSDATKILISMQNIGIFLFLFLFSVEKIYNENKKCCIVLFFQLFVFIYFYWFIMLRFNRCKCKERNQMHRAHKSKR